jgi:hypothetical protein
MLQTKLKAEALSPTSVSSTPRQGFIGIDGGESCSYTVTHLLCGLKVVVFQYRRGQKKLDKTMSLWMMFEAQISL